MGAWEDGFAAGYTYGLKQGARSDQSPPLDVAEQRVIRSPTRKRKGTPLKGMSAAMKKANAKAKLKSGKFRKGWDQSRLMSYAHKIRRD